MKCGCGWKGGWVESRKERKQKKKRRAEQSKRRRRTRHAALNRKKRQVILIVTLIVTVFDVVRRIYLVKKAVTFASNRTRLLVCVCSFTLFIVLRAFVTSYFVCVTLWETHSSGVRETEWREARERRIKIRVIDDSGSIESKTNFSRVSSWWEAIKRVRYNCSSLGWKINSRTSDETDKLCEWQACLCHWCISYLKQSPVIKSNCVTHHRTNSCSCHILLHSSLQHLVCILCVCVGTCVSLCTFVLSFPSSSLCHTYLTFCLGNFLP